MYPCPPFGVGAPVAATANKSTTFSSGLPSNGANSFVKVADGGQWPNMLPHQPSLFPATGSQPTAQPFTPPVSGSSNNQPWNLSIASNPQGPSSIPSAQISQAFSKPAPDVTSQSSSWKLNQVGEQNFQRIYSLQLIHLLYQFRAGKLVHPRDMDSICNITILQ
ncbi:unnamed protein product [Camellia sinensis]